MQNSQNIEGKYTWSLAFLGLMKVCLSIKEVLFIKNSISEKKILPLFYNLNNMNIFLPIFIKNGIIKTKLPIMSFQIKTLYLEIREKK